MKPPERGKRERRRGREAGTAVVEFAVILPLFLLLVFGIVDFGRAMNYKNSATQLANMAARYASVNRDPTGGPPSCGSIKSYLLTQAHTGELATMLGNGTLTIGLPDGKTVGGRVSVTVHLDFSWLPYIKQAAGGSAIGINGLATMRLEQPPTFSAGSC